MVQSLDDLKRSCKGSVCEPGDEGYVNKKWAPNSNKTSKVIVTPEEVEDIAKAIKYARSQGLPIAIRGGGHSTSTASATDGLLISMRKMAHIRVDEEAKIGYFGTGALMGQVEVETAKYGLGACTGVCSEVSIGGYTLGGGMGLSLGMYGMACDNLVSATVILANGDIVQANETEHSDLLWGLKGGGSNFGVVAEIGVKLHSQRPDIYVTNYAYPREKLETVVDAINQWRKTQKLNETIAMLIALGPDGNPYATIMGFSISAQEEGEASFRPFLELGPVNIMNMQIPWREVPNLASFFNTMPGGKAYVGAHIDNFDAQQVQKAWDAWAEIVKKAPFSTLNYEFYPDKTMVETPTESAAYAQRYPYTTVLCGIIGFDESDEFASRAWDEVLKLKSVVSGSSSKGAQETLGYSNYGDPFATKNNTDEYARKLFGTNYPRLQRVKKTYDPEMIFNKWFAVRPEV